MCLNQSWTQTSFGRDVLCAKHIDALYTPCTTMQLDLLEQLAAPAFACMQPSCAAKLGCHSSCDVAVAVLLSWVNTGGEQ